MLFLLLRRLLIRLRFQRTILTPVFKLQSRIFICTLSVCLIVRTLLMKSIVSKIHYGKEESHVTLLRSLAEVASVIF